MATFTIEFECDNSAFSEDPGAEIANLLREAADKAENRITPNGDEQIKIMDSNGNSIGRAVWVADQQEETETLDEDDGPGFDD